LDAVVQIRRLLADWLESSKESRESVAEILRLLEPIESSLRNPGQRSKTTASLGRGGTTTYVIEKKKNEQEVLVEHREGGSTPYRCPRYVFAAVVKTLADTKALAFEDVVNAVHKAIADAPDWQIRVVLRFLANAQPPLIVRERNKYRPFRAGKFEQEAKTAWEKLARATK